MQSQDSSSYRSSVSGSANLPALGLRKNDSLSSGDGSLVSQDDLSVFSGEFTLSGTSVTSTIASNMTTFFSVHGELDQVADESKLESLDETIIYVKNIPDPSQLCWDTGYRGHNREGVEVAPEHEERKLPVFEVCSDADYNQFGVAISTWEAMINAELVNLGEAIDIYSERSEVMVSNVQQLQFPASMDTLKDSCV